MNYFDGNLNQEVSTLDVLKNMNQDMANSLATGPQVYFFRKLDDFNYELTHYNLPNINVTNAWNWSPGTYKHVKALVEKKLQMHKKTNGIDNFIRRTRDYNNYLSYFQRQAESLELQKRELKRLGVTRNINVEEFKIIATAFADKIESECNKVKEFTNNKVIFTPYFDTNYDRKTMFYLDIQMNNLHMDIFSGEKSIQKIELLPIHIICKASLRHYINKKTLDWNLFGKYNHSDDNGLFRFPYISHYENYRRRDEGLRYRYGGVCLDNYTDDIKNAFRNYKYTEMAMHLLQWSQTYSIETANPYNSLKFLHLGIPKSYSKEYSAITSNVENDCGNRLKDYFFQIDKDNSENNLTLPLLDKLNRETTPCLSINCQLKDKCNYFQERNEIINAIKNPNRKVRQIESIVGYLFEYFTDWTEYDIQYEIDDIFGLSLQVFDNLTYEENVKNMTFGLFNGLLVMPEKHLLSYIITFFNCYPYCTVVESKEITGEDENIKKAMLAWATNPERSNRREIR